MQCLVAGYWIMCEGEMGEENTRVKVVSEPLSLPRLVCHTLEEGEPKIRRYGSVCMAVQETAQMPKDQSE